MSQNEVPPEWRGVLSLQAEIARHRHYCAKAKAREEAADEAVELVGAGGDSAQAFRCVTNRMKKHLRRQSRTIQDGKLEVPCASTTVADLSSSLQFVRHALAKLRSEEIELFVELACGHSFNELAEVLHCPSGTLKARASRARARLLDDRPLKEVA